MKRMILASAAILALSTLPPAAVAGPADNSSSQSQQNDDSKGQTGQKQPNPQGQATPDERGAPRNGPLTPPPADAFNKTYIICTKEITDNCVNRYTRGSKNGERAESGEGGE